MSEQGGTAAKRRRPPGKLGPVGLPARPLTFVDFAGGGTPTDAANFNSMQDGLIEIAAGLVAAPSPVSVLTAEATLEWGHTYFVDATAASFNVNLPTAAGAGKPIRIILISTGAHQVTVLPHAAEKIRAVGVLESSIILSSEATTYNSLEVISDGTNPNVL